MVTLLSMNGVTKTFRVPASPWRFWARPGTRVAVNDTSLRADGGDVLCLLGPNGAGKTTLLKMAAGAVLPNAGYVDAVPAAYVDSGERSFYWRLSAHENLRFFAVLFRTPRREVTARVVDALTRVGLEGRSNDAVRTLSAGMRQRLAFARALLADARLLLVDDFAAGLDYETTVALAQFLGSFVADGERAVVAATHQLWLARLAATKVVVLARGRVVAEGGADDVLGRARGRYGTTVPLAHSGTVVEALASMVEDIQITAGPDAVFVSFSEPDDVSRLGKVFAVLRGLDAGPVTRQPETTETAFLSLIAGERGRA